MNPLSTLALAAFDDYVSHSAGFRPRAGQRQMAERIATALADVDLGEHEDPHRAIAVIQAGTGVGKSAAYTSTLVAMALARKTRVLISTATVALQEQLITKDLPALAQTLSTPLVVALAKGRGRYVCKLKLEGALGMGTGVAASLFDDDSERDPTGAGQARHAATQERRDALYGELAKELDAGRWDGDRDNLTEQPEAMDWAAVAAERHTCTARKCPRFAQCSYYQARAHLAEAQVIVANHDLVLSSLGMNTLPDLDNCLVVFDEGHHLPAVALGQFSSSMDLSNLRWLDRLPRVLNEVATELQLDLAQDVTTLAQQLKSTLNDLARLAMDFTALSGERSGRELRSSYRFANGELPDALCEPTVLIDGHAQALSKALESLGAAVKQLAKEDPGQSSHCATLYAKLGALAPKINSVVSTAGMWLEAGEQPLSKWVEADASSGWVNITAHACPIVPGDLLRQHLWPQVRGAVITSASLTSCNSFDFFLTEAGLSNQPVASTLAVDSPFDYAQQGRLIVASTRADPKAVEAYTREMVDALLADLAQVPRGALVLFTSRAQMQVAVSRLPAALSERVLVQGSLSRTRLLERHSQRVARGEPSVIFGMQSFGEGLDLPGELCETVFITKLPFSSPSDPVDEARAEWLRSIGRDPFSELVIPATGVRLLQWTGRAIRTEEDQATVVCYDHRLVTASYGRRLLSGLPPYRLERRSAVATAP